MSAILDTPVGDRASRGSGQAVAAVVARLDAALDEAGDASIWPMTDGELSTVTVATARVVSRVQGLLARLVGEVDAREICGRTGASSTTGWVRHELVTTLRQARQLAAVASGIRLRMPGTGQALSSGRISLGHAAVIVSAVQALPTDLDPVLADRAESDLIAYAQRFDPEQLARLGERILSVVAPEVGAAIEAKRLETQEERAGRRCAFTITSDGHGLEWLRGTLDTEAAAVLRAALAPLSAPRPSAADGVDLRTSAHRRGDALVELARRALAADDLPDIGTERPHVTVTVPLATLLGGLGASALDDGRRLSPATARRLACDCRLIPAVLGGPGEVLDVGRGQRLFTGARRRALVLRDRGCAFPGCDRPPTWCDGHHIVHWADGGPTSLANGVLLCGHHHGLVHRDGWTTALASDGIPEFTPPPHVDPTGTPQRNYRHLQPG